MTNLKPLVMAEWLRSFISGFSCLSGRIRHQASQFIPAPEKSLYTQFSTTQYDLLNAVAKCRDPITGQLHVAVSEFDGKLKPCVLCTSQKVKTSSGWYCYTRKRCSACKVPLCCNDRQCFDRYHSALFARKPHGQFWAVICWRCLVRK